MSKTTSPAKTEKHELRTPAVVLPFTPDDLRIEFERCKPGDYVVYYRGNLPRDREHARNRDQINLVADFALRMGLPSGMEMITFEGRKIIGMGLGMISQRKISDGHYEYRLQRRT